MTMKLTHVQIWVLDQDQALDWYTNKLGFEVREDVTVPELGNFRWLSVGPPGQEDVKVTLMAIPGQPVFDAETEQAIKATLAKGGAGGLFFVTDDIQGTYAVIGAGGALAAGAGGVQLQNEKGVILQLAGGKVGVELSAAVGGVTIALK